MKKKILLLSALLSILSFLSLIILFIYLALMSGTHHYKYDNVFSYWLYTPHTLKNAPKISSDVEYSYYYDLDNQQKTVVITWRDISNVSKGKEYLIDFLQQLSPAIRSDCLWVYHDPNDYSNNYQRYCVYKKWDSLELEYFETLK